LLLGDIETGISAIYNPCWVKRNSLLYVEDEANRRYFTEKYESMINKQEKRDSHG